jgi:hypothetical protein
VREMITMGRVGVGAADEIRAEIGREYPGWNPWQSSAGRWWAARVGRAPSGGAMTVDGDTPDQLRAALAEQEGIAGSA